MYSSSLQCGHRSSCPHSSSSSSSSSSSFSSSPSCSCSCCCCRDRRDGRRRRRRRRRNHTSRSRGKGCQIQNIPAPNINIRNVSVKHYSQYYRQGIVHLRSLMHQERYIRLKPMPYHALAALTMASCTPLATVTMSRARTQGCTRCINGMIATLCTNGMIAITSTAFPFCTFAFIISVIAFILIVVLVNAVEVDYNNSV